MRHSLRTEAPRRGAIIPLFAILLIPLMGMLAFSIDIGWIAVVRTDLQTAADAAALAGAEKLQELYVEYTMPGQLNKNAILTTATTNTNTQTCPMYTAETFAGYNKAGNVSITVRDQDVSFSYLDGNSTFHSNYWAQGLTGGFPNSITVITRRDSIKNTPVSLFFGPIFRVSTKELTATSTATIYSGDVTTLQAIPGVNAHILPVALDMNIWKTFYTSGQSADGLIHLANNGDPQLQVYPYGPYQGAFNLVDVGPPANNAPAFRNWIDNGETPNDIAYLSNPENNLLPVTLSGPKNWKDGPGLTDTLLTNFQNEMGKPNLIPLFMPYKAPLGLQPQNVGGYQPTNNSGGGGQNQTYAVIGFVGVTISQAEGNGSNMHISIQPYAIVDPTAQMIDPTTRLSTAKPVGTQISQIGTTATNPVITTFISAKLTQ